MAREHAGKLQSQSEKFTLSEVLSACEAVIAQTETAETREVIADAHSKSWPPVIQCLAWVVENASKGELESCFSAQEEQFQREFSKATGVVFEKYRELYRAAR